MTATHPKVMRYTNGIPAKMRKVLRFFPGIMREKSMTPNRVQYVFLLSFSSN